MLTWGQLHLTQTGNASQAPERLGPYKFYQYLFAVPDSDVIKFMRMLTCVPTLYPTVLLTRYLRVGYRPTAGLRLTDTNG